jgi:hypothetical protein
LGRGVVPSELRSAGTVDSTIDVLRNETTVVEWRSGRRSSQEIVISRTTSEEVKGEITDAALV